MVDRTWALPPVFTPDLVYAVGLFNKEYGLTREFVTKLPKYDDIKEVVEDEKRVTELFKQVLKIPDKNITILRDATHD